MKLSLNQARVIASDLGVSASVDSCSGSATVDCDSVAGAWLLLDELSKLIEAIEGPDGLIARKGKRNGKA